MRQSRYRTGLMVAIPAGTILVGAPEHHLDDIGDLQHYPRSWFEDEAPQHEAGISTFWLDVHPVTNAAFAEFVDATGYQTAAERRGFGLVYAADYWQETSGAHWLHPGGCDDSVHDRMDHPVVHVDLSDARAYAAWAGLRLPTETEWAYAAHGPTWRTWPWGNDWNPNLVNCAEHAMAGHGRAAQISDFTMWKSWWSGHFAQHATVPATTPVGAFSPAGDSPFGIADLAGNVLEWTDSAYRLYDPDRVYDPIYRAAEGRYQAVRGGNWMSLRFQTRTTERFAVDPAYSHHGLGFRCASDTPPS